MIIKKQTAKRAGCLRIDAILTTGNCQKNYKDRFRSSCLSRFLSGLDQVVFLDIFEVTIGADLQFVGGGLVADDDAMLVHLESADGPHVVDTTLDGSLQGTCLVVTVDKNHHLAGSHHRTHAHGKSEFWHFVDIVVEETGVGDDRIGGQRLNTGA